MNFKLIVTITVSCLYLMLFPQSNEAKIKSIQGSFGRYDPTNYGFQEFIGNSLDYNIYTTLGGTDYFDFQLGLSYWQDKQIFAGKDYALKSIFVPIRFLYNFHPAEKWVPFFGAGFGLHFLIEEYITREAFWTVSYTTFAGFRYVLSEKLFLTNEINYSYGTFSGIDNLNVEGVSIRLGLGYTFN